MNNNKKIANKARNSQKGNRKPKVVREQPKSDGKDKRVNYDNERISKVEDCNDPSWYASSPELMRSAASIPFSQTTGQKLQFTGNTADSNVAYSVPGILSLTFYPSLGGRNMDALNAAKDQLYSYVVHANSRNTKYNAADLMEIVVAGCQVYAILGNMIRAYGVARQYSQINKYLPDGILKAIGFDPADIKANLSTMWFQLNELIAQSTQIWIPNTMPVLTRWFWLNSNVYMDSNSPKGQFYVFTQEGYLVYNETQSKQGGMLTFINEDGSIEKGPKLTFNPGYGKTYTWAQWYTVASSMIGALVNSEDRGIMMGDILKAYGADKIYALSPISSDYSIQPVYNPEVLTQIENSTMYANLYFGIYQNPNDGRLYQGAPDDIAPTLQAKLPTSLGIWVGDQSVLNFHQIETPTPDQVMVATRLKCAGVIPSRNITNGYEVATAGTEYVTGYSVFYYSDSTTLTYMNVGTHVDPDAKLSFKLMQLWNSFDWAPWIYQYGGDLPTASGETGSVVVNGAFGDYDNYTIIEQAELLKMHNTALYSEFGVPII